MADDANEDHDHDHEHPALTYVGCEVDEGVLESLRPLHPDLAEALALGRRLPDLTDDERAALKGLQKKVEAHMNWTPGYHADGDKCATCGAPVPVLFSDRFAEGGLAYEATIAGLPVHATQACIAGFDAKHPRRAPQAIDRARRTLVRELERPSPGIAMFFRYDLLAHPPFALEDWANSVAEANPAGLDRATRRDIERLLGFVHRKLYH